MKFQLLIRISTTALALALTPLTPVQAATEDLLNTLEILRGDAAMDRQAFLVEMLDLTPDESAAFWPLYHRFQSEKEKLGDGLIKLALEYSDSYPHLTEDQSRRLLKDYLALEKKLGKLQAQYLHKIDKKLPATKVFLFAQIENRLDLALRLQLASVIPVLPVKMRPPSPSSQE